MKFGAYRNGVLMPYGARNRTIPPGYAEPSTWGSSWVLATTPFCEASPLFDRVNAADIAGSDYTSVAVRAAAGRKIRYLICPSAPFPEFEDLAGQKLTLSSYAGIMVGEWNRRPRRWCSANSCAVRYD